MLLIESFEEIVPAMAEKRILLIESGHFIGGVIHSLFVDHNHLSVTEVAPANCRELLNAVEKHQPEIVVMDNTVSLTFLSILLRYMQNSNGVRVVVLNTDSNQVELYQKQQIDVHKTADFFAIL